MEICVNQDQILTQLKQYSETRGCLRQFCQSQNLPYWKVWKFTNGEIKKLSMQFGCEISKAIELFNSQLKSIAAGDSNG